jgi:hypothetical protein
MKWETIKENCIRTACTNFRHNADIFLITLAALKIGEIPQGKGTIRQRLSNEVENEIVKLISNWDVRQYASLKQLFPQHFPKTINGIEFDDDGWILV